MPKFKTKLVIIDAEQWFPNKPVDGVQYPPPDDVDGPTCWEVADDTEYGILGKVAVACSNDKKSPDPGYFIVHPGDWIVTWEDGYQFPCGADDFEELYEPVDNVKDG